MSRLALFATHPIQYHVPWFRGLEDYPEIDLTVYFDQIPDADEQGVGFDMAFKWDLPLLDGYSWQVYSSKAQGEDRQFSSLRRVTGQADAVLITGWQSGYLRRAALWSAVQGTPSIVRGESNALKPYPFYVRLLHCGFLGLFQEYLYIGEANAAFYRQYGVSDQHLHPCRYFVENERFDQDYQALRPDRDALRSSFEIPDEATCFLFAGKFTQKKQPQILLQALGRLYGTHNVHVLMVGNGPLMDDLKTYANNQDLPVSFTGFLNQSEIGKAYTAADVLVLPSNYGERWGLVVNEAMIFECPAVVSDRVGCGSDLVEEGETGFTFPFGEVDALAERMRQLAASSEERQSMGANARRKVMEEYSVQKGVEGTVNAVRAAVA